LKTKIFILILIAFIGCKEDDFSPVGNYEKKIVTYAVLDNRFENQIIKIQSAYLTEDGNIQAEKKISNIKVSISDGTNNYALRDTVVSGAENYSYFVLDALKLNRGAFYSLKITGDNVPDATAQIRVPANQDITLFFDTDKILLTYSKNHTGKGFLHHFYVDFYIKEGTKILNNYRVEIPSEMVLTNEGADTTRVYPSLTKEISHEYSYSALFAELNAYLPADSKQKLVVKRSIATVLSLEENLYNYVSTVKGFSDPVSVRLDQINYSNITNGYGIFGAITIDSVTVKIPVFIVQGFGFESE
jgi:hypothetical protein